MSTIKPREAEIVIYQGDDLTRLAELRKSAEVARRAARRAADLAKASPLRVGDDVSSTEDEDEALPEEAAYDAAVEEAAERAVVVRIRAIGRRRFRDLMAEHPPRKVMVKRGEGDEEREVEEAHPDDASFDVNTETFGPALLGFVDPDDEEIRTIAEPEFSRKALAAFIDDEISEGDFESMWVGAYYLNRSPSADPKASRYSTASPRSTAT